MIKIYKSGEQILDSTREYKCILCLPLYYQEIHYVTNKLWTRGSRFNVELKDGDKTTR